MLQTSRLSGVDIKFSLRIMRLLTLTNLDFGPGKQEYKNNFSIF